MGETEISRLDPTFVAPNTSNPSSDPQALLPPPTPPPRPPPPPSPSFSLPIPAIRVTSEFDSDSVVFFHKISCRFFDRLAKLKLSFQNNRNGDISEPQLSFITKYLSILYDPEERNALVKGSFDVGSRLQFRASQDIKSGQIGEANYYRVGCSRKCLSMSCTANENKSILTCINFGSVFLFKYHHIKAQQGEVSMLTTLNDGCKLELSSCVPAIGLPRATVRFPFGEVSVQEKEDEEVKRVLSVNGILTGRVLNGVCTAQYRDNDLNLRYAYKDTEMTIIPSVSLPSNVFSFGFKRRFTLSDKLSYWYNFDSNHWSTVYKHTMGKNLKFKSGYDSDVRLGWASLWVGEEDGKAKAAPMKMKVQFMLQVPQDDIASSVFLFRVKKSLLGGMIGNLQVPGSMMQNGFRPLL